MNRIVFNTHRGYTQEGQRIAAQEVEGGFVAVDADRGIYLFVEDVLERWMPLSEKEVMRAYDHNWYADWTPMTEKECALREELRAAALAI